MADVRHTLMREDISLVNARAYGSTRDSTTILAALAAIAARPCQLMLMDEADGIWTLTSDVTIPANVTLCLPSGVVLQGSGTLTILGGVIALRQDWFQGTGALIWDASALPSTLGLIRTTRLTMARDSGADVTLQRAASSTAWTLTLPPTPGTPDQALLTDGSGVTRWQTVQALDPLLTALAGLTTGANQALYFTGPDAPALTTLTPYARTLLDDATPADMQSTLALIPGTHVQPWDADLSAFAGQPSAANTLFYWSAAGVGNTTPLTPYSRTLFDDPDAATWRGTLGLGALAQLSTVTTPYLTDASVTYAKVQDVTDGRLLGRAAGSPGVMQELSVSTAFTLAGGVLGLSATALAPGGTAGQAQWNNGGSFAGSSGLILNATQVTDGRVSLGGHASTGVLDIQNSIQASDVVNGYFGLRLWPVAPSGAVYVQGIRIQPATGLGLAGAGIIGVSVMDQPGASSAWAYHGGIMTGANRWNLYMQGTAPNWFGGTITIGGHVPTAALDVQSTIGAGNTYIGAAFWPVAPSGATTIQAIRIEPSTGAAVASSQYYGVVLSDPHASHTYTIGLHLNVSSGGGGNRYNIMAQGTAANWFYGAIGIGPTANPYGSPANLQLRYTAGVTRGIDITPSADTSTGALFFFNAAGGFIGSITTNATTTFYNTTSDRRLKRSIEPLSNALATIGQLRPVTFRWNVDDSQGHGFLADEVQRILPELITGEPDAIDAQGAMAPQAMDHGRLTPWLTAAIQELLTRLEALEARP